MASEMELVPRSEVMRMPNFEPASISELKQFATFMADSSLVPKEYLNNVPNCMVAMMMGRELGLSPMQSLQGIAVINGKPSVWGDALWALVMSHPEFGGFEEIPEEGKHTTKLVRIKRGVSMTSVGIFSMEDARNAGLLDKNTPWKTYPRRMLMWRARTYAARDLFPDALKGLTTYEEMQDYVPGDVVQSPRQPQPSAAAATSAPVETKGGQAAPAPEKKAEESATISADEVKEFSTAYKKSGWDLADARAFMVEMSERLGVTINRSGLIPKSEFKGAMVWASTPKSETKPAEAETKVDETEEIANSEAMTEMKKAMVRLQMSMFEQEAFVQSYTKDGKVDFYSMAKTLSSRLRAAGLED